MLVKSECGLVEEENFYLTSVADFLTENTQCYIIDNSLLISKSTIERNFLLNEFVIELYKSFSPKSSKDVAFFYVSNGERFGISERFSNLEQQNFGYWKIIYYDGFIQTYKSKDGLTWLNMGGAKVDNITSQGFEVIGNTPFIFKDYRVYKNPYITIYNYPNDYNVELIDKSNQIVKRGIFKDNKCKIFLDYCFLGKIKILNTDNNIVSITDLMQLSYGDEFFLSPYDIEIYYNDNKYNCSDIMLENYLSTISIKNVSNQMYENLNISVSKPDNNFDDIKLSLNETDFYDCLILENLNIDETKQIYIKINAENKNNPRYRNFDININ